MLTQADTSLIKEVMNLQTLPKDYQFSRILEASKLIGFFVKPTEQPVLKKVLETAIELGKELGQQFHTTKKENPTSLAEATRYVTGYLIIFILKSFYDDEYFRLQLQKANVITEEDKANLETQIMNLSKEELKSFFELVNNYNINHCFITPGHIFDLNQELNNLCSAADPTTYDIDKDFDFYTSSDLFRCYEGEEFNYLDHHIIAEILLGYIDGEIPLLVQVAQTIHTSGRDVAEDFIVNYFKDNEKLVS